jgi:hypothetical protein
MNTRIFCFYFLLNAATCLAATPNPGKIRTIANTPALVSELQQEIDPKIYEKLSTYPIEAWIIVRGRVAGDHISGATVSQSDLNGAYDSQALKLVNSGAFRGSFATETRIPTEVFVHVLIYNFVKKRMALVFIHAEQMRYNASPRLMPFKPEH